MWILTVLFLVCLTLHPLHPPHRRSPREVRSSVRAPLGVFCVFLLPVCVFDLKRASVACCCCFICYQMNHASNMTNSNPVLPVAPPGVQASNQILDGIKRPGHESSTKIPGKISAHSSEHPQTTRATYSEALWVEFCDVTRNIGGVQIYPTATGSFRKTFKPPFKQVYKICIR